MAQKPISTAAAERMNLVAQDEIWKCRLKAETEARKNWAQNWGFLTTPLEQELLERKSSSQMRSHPQMHSPFVPRGASAVTKVPVFPFQVLPSPPVPETTQGFIGWRSGQPGLNKCLEHDQEIRSCKGAYAKELGWPKQAYT
uniref:Ciliary microtubule inner protein 1 n=1 Tax=Loxodonta africana TaxID=9785 RepID=G3TTM4_LOXAF